ncbi:MAG: zf-TFIIB domain-containing protein [Myxococcales bacterium]|nr:zf-TFIIB domain-containing protein [Myxococcales bacterium]
MRCPACDDEQLSKHGACRACGGIWLSEELVHERLARAPMFTGGGYSERHCPACDETMDEPLLFDVPIDRCAAHGMWFDKAELEQVIARANLGGWKSTPPPKPEDSLRMLIAAVGAWDRPKRS